MVDNKKAPLAGGALREHDQVTCQNIDRSPYGQLFDLRVVEQLAHVGIGMFDVPCPICGPLRRTLAKQRKPVLRIWYLDPAFASFCCARCGEHGYVRDVSTSRRLDPAQIERAKAEAERRKRETAEDRQKKAAWLWSQRRPIIDTMAEGYLQTRGITCPWPQTLGFLPARGDYCPAMIAAFGIPTEPEPGQLDINPEAIVGIHLTRLKPDGSGKADEQPNKIMIGMSAGLPIVLAPPNDLLGLAITEGIEDGLSVYQASGLGVWCAGSASRLPALAKVVPSCVEAVSILVDDDDAGRRHAGELASRLQYGGIEVRLVSYSSGPT